MHLAGEDVTFVTVTIKQDKTIIMSQTFNSASTRCFYTLCLKKRTNFEAIRMTFGRNIQKTCGLID